MKRQYVKPSIFCVKLDTKRTFLQSSYKVSDDVIEDEGDAGWAREDNNTNDDNNNRGSIWDNAW